MKLRTLAVSLGLPVLVLSAVALAARPALQGGMIPEQTAQHEMLETWSGTWDATMNMPSFGVADAKGTSTRKMVGGLWLVEDYAVELMGTPFRGHGITGYDAEKKQFVGMWVDSWSDRMLTFDGAFDEETKTLTFEVPGRNPMTGEAHVETHETRVIDGDTVESRMLWPGENGERLEVMVIRYERRK